MKQDIKAKKFKRKPELLEEDIISCSQFSVLQLQDLQDISESFSQHSLQEEKEEEVGSRPSTYRKQPLNKPMSQRSRRRRVEEKREILQQWAKEEGVSVTVLLGLFLYLENWNGGNKNLASIGWKIFLEEAVVGMSRVRLEEAIWLMERSGMSQVVYLELRLRLKDRIYFPPVMHVRAENQRP